MGSVRLGLLQGMEKWTTFMRRDAATCAGSGGVARMCLTTLVLVLAQKMRDRKKKESGHQ
jgi:hypothetical protein